MTTAQFTRRLIGLNRKPYLPFDHGLRSGLAIYGRRILGILTVALTVVSLALLMYGMTAFPWSAVGLPFVFPIFMTTALLTSEYVIKEREGDHPTVALILMRISEAIVALLGLLILVPALLAIIACMWIAHPRRRVFYRAVKGITPDGRLARRTEFNLPPHINRSGQSRPTQFAKWLEVSRLAYAPALWDVLTGDLSLFGKPSSMSRLYSGAGPVEMSSFQQPGLIALRSRADSLPGLPENVEKFYQLLEKKTKSSAARKGKRVVLFRLRDRDGNAEYLVCGRMSHHIEVTLEAAATRRFTIDVDTVSGRLSEVESLVEGALTAWKRNVLAEPHVHSDEPRPTGA